MKKPHFQSEIVQALQAADVPFELELSIPNGALDVAIIHDGWLFGIVKRKLTEPRGHWRQLKRIKLWRSLGVPVCLLEDEAEIPAVVYQARDWVKGVTGCSLESFVTNPELVNTINRRRSARVPRPSFRWQAFYGDDESTTTGPMRYLK